ncbi:phosphatidate cytidylyltransferase [Aspergillus rambellii]|uniref:Phosphatidate cytidylyltransferase n=1 Tax=Aspergillus rambellii TaxID=308745 RepID=A0A0F8VU39_9EURO|nr:phosphatidate cytidylyltransferase [Aspergillus rambellii]
MSKPRRNVRFNHRSSDARRLSISDASDAASEPGSPSKNGSVDKPATILEKPEQSEYEKKKQTFITRTIWTFVMIAGFFIAMFSGHIYIIGIVTAIQIISFKEVIAIANVPSKEKNIRFTKSLNWYFLATSVATLGHSPPVHQLYTLCYGLRFFVASLQKGHYLFQFTQFAWTHMALYLIVVQAHFVMNNILEGMIWFFLPASLVITNDIFAYVCGITFGRTQLIQLSPKKTVEGFMGAWICTIIFGYFMTNVLMRYKYFICPVNDLGSNVLTGLQCVPNPAFVPQPYHIPEWTGFGRTFYIEPMQFHILVFASFASLIAPFGGFFASGLKRTFKIKDFGESIPGHGGITDRMDCQFIMGFFAYMYYHSFIAVYKASVGDIIEAAINGLTPEEQLDVVRGLSKYLFNQGTVSETVLECLSTELKH